MLLLMIDREAPAAPRDDDVPSGTWRRRLTRLQDRLWDRDETWAAQRGYTVRRSRWGWSIEIHDPAFDDLAQPRPGGSPDAVTEVEGGDRG
jgi:hypothetical protein